MKMLATKTTWTGWQWVAYRNPTNNSIVTTPFKEHALGAEDLEYFRDTFPEMLFAVVHNLNGGAR